MPSVFIPGRPQSHQHKPSPAGLTMAAEVSSVPENSDAERVRNSGGSNCAIAADADTIALRATPESGCAGSTPPPAGTPGPTGVLAEGGASDPNWEVPKSEAPGSTTGLGTGPGLGAGLSRSVTVSGDLTS